MKDEKNSLQFLKNRGHSLLSSLEAELEEGKITEDQWYARVAEVITPAYLSAANPRAQSGHSGNEVEWEWARSLVLEGVHKSGSFLDIGCANGHLMESVEAWGMRKGISLELYGLDIAPELVSLAQERLPQYSKRLFVGNAMSWNSPQRFDFVRTGLEYVPTTKRREYVSRLLEITLAPGGLLLIGTFNEEKKEYAKGPLIVDLLRDWGFSVLVAWEREHRRDARLAYKVIALSR